MQIKSDAHGGGEAIKHPRIAGYIPKMAGYQESWKQVHKHVQPEGRRGVPEPAGAMYEVAANQTAWLVSEV